VISCFS